MEGNRSFWVFYLVRLEKIKRGKSEESEKENNERKRENEKRKRKNTPRGAGRAVFGVKEGDRLIYFMFWVKCVAEKKIRL